MGRVIGPVSPCNAGSKGVAVMVNSESVVVISGEGLSLADIAAVSRGAKVRLSGERAVRERVEKSLAVIRRGVEKGEQMLRALAA